MNKREKLINDIKNLLQERADMNQKLAFYRDRIEQHYEMNSLSNLSLADFSTISLSQPRPAAIDSFIEDTHCEVEKEKKAFAKASNNYSQITNCKAKIQREIENQARFLSNRARPKISALNSLTLEKKVQLLSSADNLANILMDINPDEEKAQEIKKLIDECTFLSNQVFTIQTQVDHMLQDIDQKHIQLMQLTTTIHQNKSDLDFPDSSKKIWYVPQLPAEKLTL
ncbi:hypothetical protein GPJ56_004882 [Histomonas meleagridis]|uniref:uncharacterized protein n=1 Tax=Histomonas meleagridis TaxID=135588 RepID=UPI0035594D6A|nr:hypothetical protein GPJ56_004882 [Histomonas meleagridis]KAH0803532.1 hypothetical protein GO595_003876 [Histomonas meleagridis]